MLGHRLLPFPTCIIYGEADWMCGAEQTWGIYIVKACQDKFGSRSKMIIVPDAGHFGYFDNPLAYSNAIINCLIDTQLPITTLQS